MFPFLVFCLLVVRRLIYLTAFILFIDSVEIFRTVKKYCPILRFVSAASTMTGRPGWGPSWAASTPATSSSPARAASPASSSWPCGAPCGPTAPSATQSTSTPSILCQETLEVTKNIGKNWPQGHAPMISVPILSLDPQLITWNNFTIGSENHDNTRYND